jgi:SAM-dependent methyltransferase
VSTPPARLSAITHGDLAFHDPLDPAVVDEVLDLAALGPADRALDLGCGPGELLVRLAERTGCGGLGVDLAAGQIEEARRRAATRAPQAGLEFLAADAGTVDGEFALSACVGPSTTSRPSGAPAATTSSPTTPGSCAPGSATG